MNSINLDAAKLVPLSRTVLTSYSFSYPSMLVQGTLLMLFLLSLGKPQFSVTDLGHCLKRLHFTVKSKLLTKDIVQCLSSDVLLVTKLIFQEVKINGERLYLQFKGLPQINIVFF